MVLTVYLDPATINCRKVLSGLDLLEVPYEIKPISYFKGEFKSPEYTKINPCQTLPAAVDGDLILTESNAILAYAADLAKDESYYPKDPKKRADINRWLLWEASVWFQNNYVYVIENVAKPWIFKADPDQKALGEEEPKWNKGAAILDERLSKSKFLCGDNPTIADIAVAAPMHLWAPSKVPIDQHKNLKRWIQDVEKLPAWSKHQQAVDDNLMPGHKAANAANGANGTTEKSVRATINYTKDLGDKLTEIYFYEDPKSAGIHEPGDDPHEMSFTDGWHRVKEFSEDKEGFSLHDFKSTYNDSWEDDTVVREKFYPEVVDFLKRTIGATRVLVFDHTIRTQANQTKKLTQETNTSQRSPVMLVHCDYTAESGPLRVRQLLPDEAEELLKRRVAFINVWKPLNVVEERPLAMCDVTSAPPEDFFKLYLRYRDRVGENYVMRHNDRHKWWYFPQMTPEQAILLKTYDSETDGRARFVGHTAFEDPTSAKDAKMRESVEIRTIAFF